MDIINSRKEGDRPYISGLEGKQIGLYAQSLVHAKEIAVEHFRPRKRNAGLLWVELAEEEHPTQFHEPV